MNEPTWLEIFKRVITGFAVRRLLEVGGGAILTYGASADEITLVVAGIVAILVGVGWSWVQTKWLARKEPEEMKDFPKHELT